MSDRGDSANFELVVSRNVAGRAIGDALRRYVGRGKDYTVKQLYQRSGVNDRLIEAAMCDPDSTDYRHLKTEMLLSLASVIGARFTSDIIRDIGQGAFNLPDDDETPPGEIAADNADDNAVLARAAKDGRFDQAEKPDLRVVGDHLIERGMKLARLAA